MAVAVSVAVAYGCGGYKKTEDTSIPLVEGAVGKMDANSSSRSSSLSSGESGRPSDAYSQDHSGYSPEEVPVSNITVPRKGTLTEDSSFIDGFAQSDSLLTSTDGTSDLQTSEIMSTDNSATSIIGINLLNIHQSAYRFGHSTETVLPCTLNDILTALDDDKNSILLLLDLSAAFDAIDHEILLSSIEHDFGIRCIALNWFWSYLSDRRQYVLVDGQKSTETSLDFCVPQGSVLGQVLFILYTTPLTALTEKHCIRHEMFADDTQLSHSKSPDNYFDLVCSLQNCVKDIGLWMEENKLKLNSGKTEAIRFSSSSSVNIT